MTILSLVGGCAAERPEPVKGVILVVVDTLRGDYMGCSGGPVDTPHLDAIAARGARFSNARSHAPITGPSHSTMFTGKLPTEHGVVNNTQILGPEETTLAERFQGPGWKTAGFVSLGVLRDSFGMAQGFDHYDQRTGKSWSRNAGEVNAAVIPWIESLEPDAPFFLWVHYSDPHEPYAAPGRTYPVFEIVQKDGTVAGTVSADGRTHSVPIVLPDGGQQELLFRPVGAGPEYAGELTIEALRTVPAGSRFEPGTNMRAGPQVRPTYFVAPPASLIVQGTSSKAQSATFVFQIRRTLQALQRKAEYGFEVEYVDRELGKLVDVLQRRRLFDSSLFVLTSDHGEGLGDHGLAGHIHQLYDSLLHVPLIMVSPGRIPAGVVIDEPVSLTDLAGTIGRFAGLKDLPGGSERDLVQLINGTSEFVARPHIAITAQPQARKDLHAIVVDGLKLIHNPGTGANELFDVRTDPGETDDIAEMRGSEVASIESDLRGALASSEDADTAWADLDEESRKNLEALGYVR